MSSEKLSSVAIRRVMTELKDLVETPPEGIKVLPNEEDISDIQAIITGPAGTPYEGGQFRMKLKLTNEFPQAPPKGFFITKIFHPNVAKTGEICVSTLKKDWKEDLGIKHILLTVKCLLIVPNPESALNEEAGRLLLENYEEYARHAKLMTGIHAAAKAGSKDNISLTKSDSAASLSSSQKQVEDSTKENADANQAEQAAAADPAKKGPVAMTKADSKKVLDKKRSLKRL